MPSLWSSSTSLLAFVVLLGGTLPGQSLKTSPAAASPMSEDSIYALRVDSATYPGQDFVYLLSEAAVKVEADGRYTFTVHRIVQLLSRSAVDNWGQMTFWYYKDRQHLSIDHLRVIGPDGSVLHSGPAHQEEVNPPADEGDPTFTDRRGIQVTLAGVASGTLIDYHYTIEKFKPQLPGDFSHEWNLNGDAPIRRSRFSLDVPVGLPANVRVRNIAGDPVDSTTGGRRIRHWYLADVPSTDRQWYAAWPNTVQASIWVTGNIQWRTIGNWYDSLSRGRYDLTPAIIEAHALQLKGAKSLTDSLRATYRWVAQDFRYVSLSLGDGSYQPRSPQDVFSSRFGDCKDKTTLFVSLARRMGVTAYPVLLYSTGGVDSTKPTLSQFNHVIAAVQYGGKMLYLDTTDPLLPFGQMESDEQGQVGLALPASGPRLVVFPTAPVDSNVHDWSAIGAFESDGRFVGRLAVTATGTEQGALRGTLAELAQDDSSDRADKIHKYATDLWASAAVDSVRYSDGRDLNAPVNLTVWFTAPHVIGHVDHGKYYFNLPLGRFIDAQTVNRIDTEGPRRYPIEIGSVNSPSVYRMALSVQLPEGWSAEVPQDVTVQGPFGYYRARYSQSGRTLRVSREMGGGRGTLPPDSVKALRTWLASVEADRTAMIVLSRGTGVDLVASGGQVRPTSSGTLPDIVVGPSDVSTEAKVAQEGPSTGSSDFMNISSTPPVETYHRTFEASQTVFPAGATKLISLDAYASAYHTAAEARWMLDALTMFDVPRFLEAYMRQQGVEQMKIDSIRPLQLAGIGDRSAGWVFEMVTPLTNFNLAIMLSSRGRVAEAITAAGPRGMQDSDMTVLMRGMDDRLRSQDAYLHDIVDTALDTLGMAGVDSALAVATPLPLNTIAGMSADSARSTVREFNFQRNNGWPEYAVTRRGKAVTFPFGKAPALEVSIAVTQHNAPIEAVQAVVSAQRASRNQVLQTAMGSVVGFGTVFVDSAWQHDSSTLEAVALPRVGAWSEARHVRLRGLLRTDLDEVVFARGKLSVRIEITRPAGQSDPAVAASLANDILRRMQKVDAGGSETPPTAAQVAVVTRIVDAERVVDSLSEAKNIDSAFAAADRASQAHAPVTFSAQTWNSLCWWGSLGGQAQRAKAACDAAVAPDTTDLSIRDSRGLQRALAGDLRGARDDFAYIVANVVDGSFKDLRSQWLSALRDGKNPFTPAVLEQLRH